MTYAECIRSLDRIDALLLLEDCLQKDRTWIIAHDDEVLTDTQQAWLAPRVACRQAGEPLAYIRGRVAFYSREFMVTPDVLVPRPESESLIDLIKTLTFDTIVDVGCGSGALGITIGLEMPSVNVLLSDISTAALAVAGQNSRKHSISVQVIHQDLLRGEHDVVVANLPYIPSNFEINKAASFEPALALYGGDDGLDLYRKLFCDVSASAIVTEAMPFQHLALQQIAEQNGYKLTKTQGYGQLFAPSKR